MCIKYFVTCILLRKDSILKNIYVMPVTDEHFVLPKIMNKKIVVNFISPDEKTRRSCQTDDWRNAEWSPTQLKVSISPTIFSVQTVQKLPPF